MMRAAVKNTLNRELGRFLYRSRMGSRKSPAQIARSVGFSEEELLEMERAPAEVPCSKLYRLISHYGPKRIMEAQMVICEAQAMSAGPSVWGHLRFIPRNLSCSSTRSFRTTVGLALGWALVDFLKHFFRNIFLGRVT